MVQRSRLLRTYQAVIRGEGGVRFRDFEALLEALGFVLARQRGSHRIYVNPKLDRPFPVQPEGRDAKRYQIRQLRDMIAKYGLTFDVDE